MPRLYSSQKIAKTLQNSDFNFISQSGSHAKFRKIVSGKVLTVIVPMAKKEIPMGTFHSILRQSGLKNEDFK